MDADGNHLNGSKTYKLNIPKNAPAKKFWSVVAVLWPSIALVAMSVGVQLY